MHHSLKEWKKELSNAINQVHYCPTCDFCHRELIFSIDEAEIILFEPVEKETESKVFARLNEQTSKYEYVKDGETTKRKELVSSDPDKDIFKFKCPICGHILELTRKELHEHTCTYYGDNLIRFELDEQETEAAREFVEVHKQDPKKGKFFSALGQQFTYMITPGGLGRIVSIKCNKSGDTKQLTNTEDW